MKKILLLIVLVIIPAVYSAPSNINILNIEYDRGAVNVIERFPGIGYYPDRKIQPENGYLLQVISEKDDVLYEFRFSPPKTEYLDGFDGRYNLGGIEVSDFFNFSMALPSFENEKAILISGDGTESFFEIDEEKVDKKFFRIVLLTLAGLGAVLVILAVATRRRH